MRPTPHVALLDEIDMEVILESQDERKLLASP
jgi:hypothetical protein